MKYIETVQYIFRTNTNYKLITRSIIHIIVLNKLILNMAKQANSLNPPKLPINTDTLLILEKNFELNQQPIENLNIIEQLLTRVIENINQNYSSLVANFIIRRFPTYTVRNHLVAIFVKTGDLKMKKKTNL